MTPLVIIGAGGFGREVFGIVEALRASGADWEVRGFVDDDPSTEDLERVAALGTRLIGTVGDFASAGESHDVVVAIGSPAARRRVVALLDHSDVSFPSLVHPAATLGPGVVLAAGAVVAPGARLSTNIAVGRHVHIDQNVTVGHDSVLGDFSRLNPQACVSGSVRIGSGALVGASATILQGLAVGDDALVGAGAVVTRDVAASSIVKGVPAR